IVFIFSLAHVPAVSAGGLLVSDGSYPEFISASFSYSAADKTGGGVIGALLTYWTFSAVGAPGSYIIFIVGIVAFMLLLTNLSIKKVSKDIGAAVKTTYDGYRVRAEERRERKRLYIENLDEEEPVAAVAEDEFDMKIQDPDDLFDGSGFEPEPEIEMPEVVDRFYDFEAAENYEEIPEAEPYQEPQPKLDAEPDKRYDPREYRKVFSDTDIKFDDDAKNEIRGRRKIDLSATTADFKPVAGKKNRYVHPPLNLLQSSENKGSVSAADLKKNIEILENTLESFNVSAKVVNVSRGPVVTRYEVQPAPGVKVSRVVNLADDIAMNLAAKDVRIEAPVPGKSVIGIEIPNNKTSSVALKELIGSEEFKKQKGFLSFGLGKDITGGNICADIAKMPHLLIAGATGSGKSVCINSLIVSILYHAAPEDVKMIMIDPKVVELNAYNDIPHLLIPVVTDPKKASSAINWAVNEMTLRYRMFAAKGAKNLERYNHIITRDGEEKLPQILVIIDELADLMMVAAREVEDAICRIAQLGRASGIHLVIATQRPSVDVITGIIKANIPSRIAFAVSSQVDSRTILDMAGAEKLLGQGDMLYYPTGAPKPVRVQGCFITDKEVDAVTGYIKEHAAATYDEQIMEGISSNSASPVPGQDQLDDLFVRAMEVVLEYDQASTSMLQRRLRIGYARAARLVDQLEEKGIVSAPDGSKPRQVLISKDQYQEFVNKALGH
ncbi:MAG: DNA translocase FtsK, partial [Christensenellaceae bacterium]